MKQPRHAGILLHPTSLPGPYGIGELGEQTEVFIEYLAAAGADLWQILPLSPTGFGNSPYSARSTFAGNELLISLERLIESGLLSSQDLFRLPEFPQDRVDFEQLKPWKMPLLMQAADTFLRSGEHTGYQEFCSSQQDWLDDYALFMALTMQYGDDTRWYSIWEAGLADREEAALRRWREALADEIERWKVLQWLFYEQWMRVKTYANQRGVKIVGDMPIFVSAESSDAWMRRELFKTDDQGRFSAQSGVPPDAFSDTGQLWGMPVYDWEHSTDELFAWWDRRLGYALHLTDMVRIDHFRGFQAYWEVPAEDTTAENGRWVEAPGYELFSRLLRDRQSLPIIAEDLGVITPEVEALRDHFGFPGMKILQFAFDPDHRGVLDAGNGYLPHNYIHRCVAYTGTHDNQTSAGWYASCGEALRDAVRRYLARPDDDMTWSMIRAVMGSSADWAVVPMQDLFSLSDEARMNAPATVGDHNWSWRASEAQLQDRISAGRFREMAELYGRCATAAENPEAQAAARNTDA